MEAGQTVAGKYRLNRLLGTGGMATVWSATNVFTEREFAIKFMLPQVARTPEAARRFLLEAKVSARINHPNIIEVIDVGQAEDGSLFLVMELLTGQSLDVALIRRQKPPMTVAYFIGAMRDVAIALAAAHRSGVIHRDLKPTNVFLHKDRDERMVPKILDFGVSKILEEENNTALTVVGTVLGSPLYMSPEQAMGAVGIDGRTDVFAFGGILFEALTGSRAYDAPNFNALIVTIATKQPRNIDEIAPKLYAPLRALVRECLVTDKKERISSVDSIAERLGAMLPELEKDPQPLPSPYTFEPPSDPEATAAMPVIRNSDRPPPMNGPKNGKPASLSMHMSSPPKGAGVMANAETALGRLSQKQLALAAGGAGAVVVLALVAVTAVFTRTNGDGRVTRGGEANGVSAPPTVTQRPFLPADSSNGVPTMSVDQLPTAAHAPAKGNGRLSVSATGGWCSVSVDGQPRGVTPVGGFDLPAGPHRVDCVPPHGRPQTQTVNVADGTATEYKFPLDE